MEKQMVIRLIISLSILVMVTEAAIDKTPKAVEKWFKNLPYAKQKTTKFHFYFHEIFAGDNETAPVIAQANITAQSPTFFGMVRMFDNPLTIGPEPNSKQVGRAQGIHGATSLTEIALFFDFNFVFTTGPYNGSSLSVVGRVAESQEYRELQIIGGSEIFRLAQGVATAKTYFSSNTTVIVEYNVIVRHY
ncbi:dirigent protein 1-like [Nicotiana tabacum]|uniref:Dirigent protein n=1 Tax=Nicotiana tabacum TaxID=4097 RepID=A0A1S4B956_TOBAC|nr:PREDICTED: dirigent protein 1-like [Nicotiana tabacum]